MELYDWVYSAVCVFFCFLVAQVAASGNIGNRDYFSWYETHFLVGRRGLCRLIYFSPKHNGRYTLYEACSFFWSFIQVFVVGLLILLVCVEILPVSCIRICLLSMFVLVIVAEVAVTLINDIGSHFDNNKKF